MDVGDSRSSASSQSGYESLTLSGKLRRNQAKLLDPASISVLVVGDGTTTRKIIQRLLLHAGYKGALRFFSWILISDRSKTSAFTQKLLLSPRNKINLKFITSF
jgi:hypothetical protein